MSGCILPLAPEFQDPPASENFAPQLSNASPPFGSTVTKANGVPLQPFRVTISDPNLGDDLYVRWVADYPLYSTNTRLLREQMVPRSTTGMPLDQDVVLDNVDCVMYTLAPIAQHSLMVIVADRPFTTPAPPQFNFEGVTTPGSFNVGTWTLNLNCGSQSP